MNVLVTICALVSVLFGHLATNELKEGHKGEFALMFALQIISIACVFFAILRPYKEVLYV